MLRHNRQLHSGWKRPWPGSDCSTRPSPWTTAALRTTSTGCGPPPSALTGWLPPPATTRRLIRRHPPASGSMSVSANQSQQTAKALAVRRERTEAALNRVRGCVERMAKTKSPITVAGVACAAEVSRAFLYEHAEVRQLVDTAQAAAAGRRIERRGERGRASASREARLITCSQAPGGAAARVEDTAPQLRRSSVPSTAALKQSRSLWCPASANGRGASSGSARAVAKGGR